jgi:hypothetical protein
MNKITITVFLLLILTSCGALKQVPYVEPTSGDIAEIDVNNNTNGNLSIWIHSSSITCKSRRIVKMIPPGQKRKILVKASEVFTYTQWLSGENNAFGKRDLTKEPETPQKQHIGYSFAQIEPYDIYGKLMDRCVIQNSFLPKKGKTYVINTKTIGADFCEGEVFMLKNGIKTPEKIIERNFIHPWDEESEMCEPIPDIRKLF